MSCLHWFSFVCYFSCITLYVVRVGHIAYIFSNNFWLFLAAAEFLNVHFREQMQGSDPPDLTRLWMQQITSSRLRWQDSPLIQLFLQRWERQYITVMHWLWNYKENIKRFMKLFIHFAYDTSCYINKLLIVLNNYIRRRTNFRDLWWFKL